MSTRVHVTRTGTVAVGLPAAEALTLFTPEGERRWVPGWAPRYPLGETPELSEGVAFETGTEAGPAHWVVTRWSPGERRAAYSNVVPGQRSTLVDVRLDDTEPGCSQARVTYHMTSLAPEGDAFVRAFGDRYDAFMSDWSAHLRAAGIGS